MRTRSKGSSPTQSLERRLEALEKRLKALEKMMGATVRPAPKAVKKKSALYCPGCHLELPARSRSPECVWCGFRLDAVKPEKQRSSAA